MSDSTTRRAIAGKKGGKGGGGGGGATFSESPNTLRSKSAGRVLGILSAGPIKGLVDGAKSIYISDTPLQNADNSYNFKGVSWDVRHGYPDQEILSGFPSVERERTVGQKLTAASPLVRVIDDPLVDAVRIRLGLDSLASTDSGSGHMGGASVAFRVEVASGDGPFVTMLNWTISGKTTSPYEEARRIALPRGGAPWRVQVRRLTADSTSSLLSNGSSWSGYTEIIDRKLTYPDTALLGLRVDSQYFGANLQELAAEIYGMEIRIPSNYDPYKRTYSGFWDGSFKVDWTSNPAWIYYHLLTDPDVGLGQHIHAECVDVWSLYTIGRYCDELVDDGRGGREPRFTFNGALSEQQSAYDVLTLLAGVFRGMMYWGPGFVMMSQDAPGEPKRHLAPANMLTEGSEDPPVNYEGTAFSARHSVALVTWNNPKENYAPTIEAYEDPELIAEIGWRSTDVQAFGCTSQGEAARRARYIVDTERHATQTVTFRQALDGADLAPGDLIYLSDPSYAGARTGGRLVTVGADSCVMDAPFHFLPEERYRLWLCLPDGSGLEAEVENPGCETDTLRFAEPLAAPPPAGTVFALLASNLEPQQYRILGGEETDKNVYAFVALQHDPTKYERIENGLQLDTPEYSLLPSGPIPAPENLTAREMLYLAGGIAPRSMAVFSWSAPDDPRVMRYSVEVQRPGSEEWLAMGSTLGVSMDIQDTEPGVWKFSVRSFDGLGRFSPWQTLEMDLIGLLAPPPDVDLFRIELLAGNALLSWSKVDTLDLSHYELRFSPLLEGAAWSTAMPLVESLPADLTSFATPARVGTYCIKAVNIAGVESVNAAILVSTMAALEDLNVIDVLVEDPDFGGDKHQLYARGLPAGLKLGVHPDTQYFDCENYFEHRDFFIRGQGMARSGVYTFDRMPFDLGGVYTCKLSAHLVFGVHTYNQNYFGRDDFFGVDNYLNEPVSGFRVWVEMRSTTDNPKRSGASWSAWTTFHDGEYTGRAFEFRCHLETEHLNTTPVVRELSVEIDMPDRVIGENDLFVPALESGLRVPYVPPFMRPPSLAFSFQDLRPGWTYEFREKTRSGFCLVVRDAEGAPASCTMDYIAKGYGYDRSQYL